MQIIQPDVLQQLAALQNLSVAPDIDRVASDLQGPLEHYTELELRSDGKRIDLITLSDDPDAISVFLSILQARGATEDELTAVKDLFRFGAGKTLGIKLPVAGPSSGGELYIRGALPLAEVAYFLERHDVERTAIERMAALANIFDKAYTHMLAADVALPSSFTVFFTTYLTPEDNADEQRLQRALQEIGVSEGGIAAFLRLHRLLGASRPATLYFSWNIAEGKPTPQAKVDYADVRLGLMSEAMSAVGIALQADIPIQWGMRLGLRKANYGSVVIGSAGPTAVRAYFTLRF